MSVPTGPRSRRLLVSVLHAAALWSTWCSGSANPVLTRVDKAVKGILLRSSHPDHSQNPPLYVAPPAGTGAQTVTHSETKTGATLGEGASIIDLQSKRPQFSYDQNRPRSGRRDGTGDVRSGHSAGGERPAGSGFPGPQPRDHRPVDGKAYQYPPIIRKSSPTYWGFPHVWLHGNPQKLYNQAKYPASGGGSDAFLLSRLDGGYRTSAPPAPRGRHGGYEVTNELPAGGPPRTSSKTQSSAILSKGWDASVIKGHARPEKPASSITDVSQRVNWETERRQEAQWTKIKVHGARVPPARTRERPASAGPATVQVSSNLIRFQQAPHKAPPAEGGALAAHPPATTTQLPALGKALESVAPVRRPGSLEGGAPSSSEQPAAGRPVDKAPRGSEHDRKAAPSSRRLYGLRGFESPKSRAATEPQGPSSGRGSQWNRFHNRKVNKVKTGANVFSSFSPKKRFSLRGESTKTTPTGSSSPARSGLFMIQTTGESTPRSFPSGLKGVRTESTTGQNRSKKFRISKKIYGLKGFEALVGEPDQSPTMQQAFKGFELSSQTWQPKSSSRAVEASSPQRQTKPQSEASKSLLKAAGSLESVEAGRFSPDKYKRNHGTYAFLGFQPQMHWKHSTQSPPAQAGGPSAGPSPRPAAMKAGPLHISTSSVARGTRVKGKRRPRPYEPVSLSDGGARVAIVRRPKGPGGVTRSDVLGSASFSGVRPATQAPTTTTSEGPDPHQGEGFGERPPTHVLSHDFKKSPQALGEDLELDYFHKSTSNVIDDTAPYW